MDSLKSLRNLRWHKVLYGTSIALLIAQRLKDTKNMKAASKSF